MIAFTEVNRMKYIIALLYIFLLTGCGGKEAAPETIVTVPETTMEVTVPETEAVTEPPETLPPDPIRLMLNEMSLEERVGQLFLARCDDSVALEHIDAYHLGGFVLFGRVFNGQTRDSFRSKI